MSIKKDQQATAVDVEEKRDIISLLDYYSLAEIFMLLPKHERMKMEEVCPEWKEACQLAWCNIKKYKCESSIVCSYYDNCLLTQSYVKKLLLKCGVYLKEMSLSEVCNFRISMPIVGDHCKNLASLECEVNENSLIYYTNYFVQAFTQLEKLKIIKLLINFNYFDRQIDLFEIINSLPQKINEIHIFPKPLASREQTFLFTLKKFDNLRSLTLRGFCLTNIVQEIAEKSTLNYLDIDLFELPEEFLSFHQLRNIEYLKISSGREKTTNNQTTDILNNIFSICTNLKHLDIPFSCYDIAELTLSYWENFRYLEHLRISCYTLSNEIEMKIVKYLKNLKYLNLYNIWQTTNEIALKKLTELKNLECLLLFNNIKVSYKSIIAISNNCKKLKRLEIPSCRIIQSVDNEALPSDLINTSPHLYKSVFDELSKLKYLEHLNLKFVRNLEDSTIIAIANNCRNLKSLNIQGCRTISETALNVLLNLENLQELNVNYLNITDNFIIKLKGIKIFHCAFCKQLTDTGIIRFIKNNPDLEYLNIANENNSSISIDLVIGGADQATKNRKNGIILYVNLYDEKLIRASKFIESQWLVIGQGIYK